MGMILSLGTTIYGITGGGFFGVSSQNPLFGKIVQLQLFNAGCTNPDGSISAEALNSMMRVSLIIGMVHISISLLINSLRFMFKFKNFSKLLLNGAWITMIWTGFFNYGDSFMGIQSKQLIQLYIMYGCAAVIFLISAFNAGSFNPIKMLMGGLGGVYEIIQFFSDIMSYIRIFALGLSGSLIAQTFNNMAWGVWEQGGILTIFAVLVFLLGHTLNLALCVMSGAIHGLRLNYLEFYRWSFDGAGRPFKPLKKLTVE
jgi:V/A-type H+-transporting ATPase subunit I